MGPIKFSYKKLSLIIVYSALSFIFFLVLVNLIVDPYYIFRTPFLKLQHQINDRYAKVSYIKRHPHEVDSLIMGSSRMLFTKPSIVEAYLPESRFYNFGTIGSTLCENYAHIKYFTQSGYKLKNVYIGIDVALALTTSRWSDTDSLIKLHPDVTSKNRLEYYWSYLTIFPKNDLREKLRINITGKAPQSYDIEKDGTIYAPSVYENKGKDIAQQPILFPAMVQALINRTPSAAENLDALKKLTALCKEHNIRLILFTSPDNRHMVDTYTADDYFQFLREMAQIVDFWNFGGYNSITLKDGNYADLSHYRPFVSKLIAARIFGDKSTPVPDDFGSLVTKENVETRLASLKKNFLEHGQPHMTQNKR